MRTCVALALLFTACSTLPPSIDGASDADGDGFKFSEDCNDADAAVHPDADETCNGVDDDCDGLVDDQAIDAPVWYVDLDGDGVAGTALQTASCEAPDGASAEAADCADYDPRRFPGADEQCNGLDDDCDGDLDEESGDRITFFADADGDGFGDIATSALACLAPPEFVSNSDDCNDADDTIHPGAVQACGEVDGDCDGLVGIDDPDLDVSTGTQYFLDRDGDDYGSALYPVFACSLPEEAALVAGDCDDLSAAVNPGATEVCNERDDDCDGAVDDADDDRDASTGETFTVDSDGDGYGLIGGTTVQSCTVPQGYAITATDCDDASAAVFPGQTEVCNGVDDNCDAKADDEDSALDRTTASQWWQDLDGDGHGSSLAGITACAATDGWVSLDDDCDDADALVHPLADEVCDGIDNDCDDAADDADDSLDLTTGSAWHPDSDGDGWGASDETVFACEAPDGYGSDTSDCDDAAADVYPGADELCDSIDNNCNDDIDDLDATLSEASANFWRDEDGDGWGNAEQWACEDFGFGWAAQTGDCDDDRDDTYPGAPEQCDSRDNDCDDDRDEDAIDGSTYYVDLDDDGFGSDEVVIACSRPSDAANESGDCDDTNASVNPGETEICDNLDNDCNGTVDSDTPDLPQWYIDDDGDGWGVADSGIPSCNTFDDRVNVFGDCDDGDSLISPDESEVDDDGIDNDCDGFADYPTVIAGAVITEDTTWGADDPFLEVQGNVLIAEGATLTVMPCTQITFGEGRALQVEGALIARGSEDCRIQFTSSADEPEAGDWARILFASSSVGGVVDDNAEYISGSILEYVDVLYSGGETAAVQATGPGPVVRNVRIAYSGGHGLSGSGALPVIDDSVFEYNELLGAYVTSPRWVRRNRFEHNGNDGGRFDFSDDSSDEAVLVDNWTANNDNDGLEIECERTCSVQGNVSTGNGGTGIKIEPLVGTATANWTVGNGYHGFSVYSDGASSFHGNVAADNEGRGFDLDDDEGSDVAVRLTIERNVAVGNEDGNYFRGEAIYLVDNLFQRHADSVTSVELGIDSRTTGELIIRSNAFIGSANAGWLNVGASAGSDFVDVTEQYWNGLSEPGAGVIDFLVDPSLTVGLVDPVVTSIPDGVPVSYPEGLQAVSDGSVVTLTWDANPESDIGGYRVYYGLSDEYEWALSGTGATEGDSGFGVVNPMATVSGLDLSLPWRFSVAAIDQDADGDNDLAEGHHSWFSPAVYP